MPYLYTDKYISQLNNSHSAATTAGNRNSQQNNFPDRDIYFSELLDKQCLYIYNIGNIKRKEKYMIKHSWQESSANIGSGVALPENLPHRSQWGIL
jgi:hypothetical protein